MSAQVTAQVRPLQASTRGNPRSMWEAAGFYSGASHHEAATPRSRSSSTSHSRAGLCHRRSNARHYALTDGDRRGHPRHSRRDPRTRRRPDARCERQRGLRPDRQSGFGSKGKFPQRQTVRVRPQRHPPGAGGLAPRDRLPDARDDDRSDVLLHRSCLPDRRLAGPAKSGPPAREDRSHREQCRGHRRVEEGEGHHPHRARL